MLTSLVAALVAAAVTVAASGCSFDSAGAGANGSQRDAAITDGPRFDGPADGSAEAAVSRDAGDAAPATETSAPRDAGDSAVSGDTALPTDGTPRADTMPTPDTAPTRDTAPSHDTGVPCGAQYGQTRGFQKLCAEGPTFCTFAYSTSKVRCTDLCAQGGGTCVAAWDNNTSACTGSAVSCQTRLDDGVCKCSR